MAKLAFLPLRIGGGLLAGLLAKKLFQVIWTRIDDEEAPQPEEHPVRLRKLALALALEGATFRLAKGLTDHGARSAFAMLSGSWPGEKRHVPSRAGDGSVR